MITVFTPTYNRAYRISQLYESLRRQTSKAFEWIVVDDGSTDETRELIETWTKADNGFELRYFLKDNGGKHTAINLGVSVASYEWFFVVDSDDYLRDDAIEKVEEWTAGISENVIAGVSGLSMFPDGRMIGGKFSCPVGEYVDAKNTERDKYGLTGDKAEVYRTAILQKYPFPVFEGEKFLSEICVWNRIAEEGYKIRWYNYPLKVCEYLPDGLTSQNNNNKLLLDNFDGYLYSMKYLLMSSKGILKLKKTYHYACETRSKGYRLKELSKRIDKPYIYLLTLVLAGDTKNAVIKMKNRIASNIK